MTSLHKPSHPTHTEEYFQELAQEKYYADTHRCQECNEVSEHTLLFCAGCGREACVDCAKKSGWLVLDNEHYCEHCR